MGEKPLGLNDKLRQIREAKKMTQREIADFTGYGVTAVSSIETGVNKCTADAERLFREALGIRHLPLHEHERQSFKDKGHRVYNFISDRKLKEAKDLLSEMSGIVYFTFDLEFVTFYRLLECRLLINESKLKVAKEIADSLEPDLNDISDEIMYLYYCIKGLLEHTYGRFEEALKLYRKAERFMKDGYKENKAQLYNMALCLTSLGFLVYAAKFLESERKLFKDDKDRKTLEIDNWLAKLYISLRRLEEAKKLLFVCLDKAKITDDKVMTGIIMHNIGVMYQYSGDANAGIEYVDKAFEYCEKDSSFYLENLYRKGRCYIDLKYYSACDALVTEGKKLAKGNKLYTMLFESLKHLMSLHDHVSAGHILKTIDYLHNVYRAPDALYYSKTLRAYYEKRGKRYERKALKMSDAACRIYEKMFSRGELV